METLKYCKVREVKSPCRAHEFDAGIDFFVPTNIPASVIEEKNKVTGNNPMMDVENGIVKSIILKPGESTLIPSGIKVKVPKNMMLQFSNKSGVAAKRHLLVGSAIVDFGYEGECHINLHNVGNTTEMIFAGDKIVQGILIPISCAMPEQCTTETDLYGNETSERSTGGFGSSGDK